MEEIEKINKASAYIKKETKEFKAINGIVLGTGLGALINEVEIDYTLNYSDIPYFPLSTVEQHAGKLIFGKLGGKEVIVMQGRFHYYEGYNMKEITFPIRVMKKLGVNNLFVSNAAGGINPSFELSDLMIISDHINLLPENPLVGKNIDELGPRWPDMFEVYSKECIQKAEKIANENNINVKKGVYVSVSGPNLETPAEYKYLGIIGADAVGMSTVPEVLVATHMGMQCFAVSVITDLCYPEALEPVSIEKIIAAAAKAEPKMTLLIKELVKNS